MTNALADYRHYFMPARFYTIAVRGLHYGRYGSGAEDPAADPALHRLSRVRSRLRHRLVQQRSSAASDVSVRHSTGWSGSRMLVGNLEFRFPLLRPFGVSDRMYGPLPVEVAFFLDGGVAWMRRETEPLQGGRRTGDERRRVVADEPVRFCGRADRFRPSVRSPRTGAGCGDSR